MTHIFYSSYSPQCAGLQLPAVDMKQKTLEGVLQSRAESAAFSTFDDMDTDDGMFRRDVDASTTRIRGERSRSVGDRLMTRTAPVAAGLGPR
jgi:hypothetical protein